MEEGYESLYKKYGKSNPSLSFTEKVKKVMTSPTEFFEKIKGEEGIGEAFKYYIIFSLIYNLLFGTLTIFGLSGIPMEQMGFLASLGFFLPVVFFVLGIILMFISTGIIHVFARVFGGNGDYPATFKAMVYGATPSLLLGWLPFVGIIFAIYSLYLQIKGISTLHRVSMGRAFLIIFLIPMIIGIIVGLIGGLFAAAIFTPRALGAPTSQFISILRIFT